MHKSLSFLIALAFGFSLSAQDALNTDLLFHWKDDAIPGSAVYDNAYNEIWGMVVDGREYAVIGSTLGTHIFDVTDPENSVLVDFVEGAVASTQIIHRDFHDSDGFLYAVADEGFSSLQVMDLSYLPDSVSVVYDSSELFKRSHNIFIDDKILYVCGGNTTLDLYSLEDPSNPTLLIDCDEAVSGWSQIGYLHDIFVEDGIAYCNNGSALWIVDFTTPTSPVVMGDLSDYPESGYNHAGWLHESGQYYALADETHGTRIKICDVSDPTDINVLGMCASEVHEYSIAHNLIWSGDYLHVSHYYDGYYVFDCSDPTNPVLAAFYDTSTIPHTNSYEGAWGVYPLLPSGNVLVSDMQEGLFVLNPNLPTGIEEADMAQAAAWPNPIAPGEQLTLGQESAGTVLLSNTHGTHIARLEADAHGRVALPAVLPTGMYFLTSTTTSLTYRICAQQ